MHKQSLDCTAEKHHGRWEFIALFIYKRWVFIIEVADRCVFLRPYRLRENKYSRVWISVLLRQRVVNLHERKMKAILHTSSDGGTAIQFLPGGQIYICFGENSFPPCTWYASTRLQHPSCRPKEVSEHRWGQWAVLIDNFKFRRWWPDNCGLNTRRKPCTISWMPPWKRWCVRAGFCNYRDNAITRQFVKTFLFSSVRPAMDW